jgi:CheY-like chemotaxis protein
MSGPVSAVSKTTRRAETGLRDVAARDISQTVLVADGDEAHRNTVVQLLSDSGYRVIQAETGEGALAAIQGGGIDLVVSAVVMPRVDGLELLRALRHATPAVPVIAVVSGMAEIDEVYMRGASALGAKRTYTQPLTPSIFLKSVCDLLRSPNR